MCFHCIYYKNHAKTSKKLLFFKKNHTILEDTTRQLINNQKFFR